MDRLVEGHSDPDRLRTEVWRAARAVGEGQPFHEGLSLIDEGARIRLRELVGCLPGDERSAVLLHFYGGETLIEIAVREDVPLARVQTRLESGLLHLRELALADHSGGWSTLAVLSLARSKHILRPVAQGRDHGHAADGPGSLVGLDSWPGSIASALIVLLAALAGSALVSGAVGRAAPSVLSSWNALVDPDDDAWAGMRESVVEPAGALRPGANSGDSAKVQARPVDKSPAKGRGSTVVRLLDHRGAPIPGATIVAALPDRNSWEVTPAAITWTDDSPRGRTDEAGELGFAELRYDTVLLALLDPPWFHRGTPLASQSGPDGRVIELHAEPAARLQLTVDEHGEAFPGGRQPNRARFRSASMEWVPFQIVGQPGVLRRSATITRSRAGGRLSTAPLSVPLEAREIVISDTGGGLLVIPFTPSPGETVSLVL